MSQSAARVAIIYYSSTGTVAGLARLVAEGSKLAGAEVRLLRVSETASAETVAANPKWTAHHQADAGTPEAGIADVLWANAVILGSPTRFGSVTHQLQRFIDSLGPAWMKGDLAGKLYSCFTSASTPHGGHETTLLSLYSTFANWGGIIVPPGYTSPELFEAGTPLGVTHTARKSAPLSDATIAAARQQGARVAEIAARLTP